MNRLFSHVAASLISSGLTYTATTNHHNLRIKRHNTVVDGQIKMMNTMKKNGASGNFTTPSI